MQELHNEKVFHRLSNKENKLLKKETIFSKTYQNALKKLIRAQKSIIFPFRKRDMVPKGKYLWLANHM